MVRDILEYFRGRLGCELACIDGGAVRENLSFEVLSSSPRRKHADIAELLRERLTPDDRSGAIVYCATRRETEKVADFLRASGLPAEHFHAGLNADIKQDVQERFRVRIPRHSTAHSSDIRPAVPRTSDRSAASV